MFRIQINYDKHQNKRKELRRLQDYPMTWRSQKKKLEYDTIGTQQLIY